MSNIPDLKNKMEKIPKYFWILLLITVVGIFLRTYHFRDWLYFYPDQARDVNIVGDYLAGKIPLPLLGFRAQSSNFDLGAMYYYFQIASGKIFGVHPETTAYPDLLFNVLSIPLFFFFLKKYFKTSVSLGLTAIYSVSYFSIEFSRFAWNPNSMPFFIILFLLGLSEFMAENEKTHWGWIASIGIAAGVGIQLHAILIFMFLGMILAAMLISLMGNWRLWKRWLAILGIALLLNTNQILSETRHDFSNTKHFVNLTLGTSEGSGYGPKTTALAADVVCHFQANLHMITSLRNKSSCDYLKAVDPERDQKALTLSINSSQTVWLVTASTFSIIGYALLIYFFLKEPDRRKKIFLGLIALYAGLGFIVLFPIIAPDPALRYFLELFLVPYIFLGIFLELFRKNIKWFFWPAFLASIILLVGLNVSTLSAEAKIFAAESHSQPQYVVLGELEKMRDYIATETNFPPEIYMIAEGKYMQNYFYPMQYVLKEKNITLLRELKDRANIPPKVPLFFIGKKVIGSQLDNTRGFSVKEYRNFAEIGIYILDPKQ